jgi:hypothetical protein
MISSMFSPCFARPDYKAKGILEQDPFVTLDTEGVGELILLAVERGRKARSGMKMGICGECLGWNSHFSGKNWWKLVKMDEHGWNCNYQQSHQPPQPAKVNDKHSDNKDNKKKNKEEQYSSSKRSLNHPTILPSSRHGGDPGSIDFCNRIGLDYVSCSPWRVPLARLAAAQAALRADHGDGDRAKRNGRRTTTMTMTATTTTQPRLGRCRSWWQGAADVVVLLSCDYCRCDL